MVRMLPKTHNLLLRDPDKIIRPKLEFLATLGLRPAAVARTNLLKHSLQKHIVPCVQFLRGILRTDASIRAAVSHNPNALEVDLEKNGRLVVEALRRRGLSEEDISRLVVIRIGVLRVAPNRIAGIFEDLELLGLTVTHRRFVRAFATMCNLKRETAWHRLSLYESFGLSKSQVVKAFITQPCILTLTDENIQRKILFFQDELKIALSEVIARPNTLTLSMDKNILPKCSVLSVLMRSGKIRRDISLLVPLGLSNKVFSERYVKMFEKDVPDVVMAYEGKIEFRGFIDQDTEA
ncbi:hypothetical protein ACP70R_039965 [Stipagrostis hirtigluma subsp. patula]